MSVDIDRVIDECEALLDEDGRPLLCEGGIESARLDIETDSEACVAMASLTGARFHEETEFDDCLPDVGLFECGATYRCCAEALLAQWESLDTSEAFATSGTKDLS